jgi:hypothetical protein
MDDGLAAGYELVRTGTLVTFDVADLVVRPTPGGDETEVRVELRLGELDEDGERTEDVEWGAFGFIFVLALLSFAEATPAGASEKDFVADDQFTVADLLEHLRYERGELRFSADYLRGRRLKTDITVRPDGCVTLRTRCRGEAAKRWVEKLKGPRRLHVM